MKRAPGAAASIRSSIRHRRHKTKHEKQINQSQTTMTSSDKPLHRTTSDQLLTVPAAQTSVLDDTDIHRTRSSRRRSGPITWDDIELDDIMPSHQRRSSVKRPAKRASHNNLRDAAPLARPSSAISMNSVNNTQETHKTGTAPLSRRSTMSRLNSSRRNKFKRNASEWMVGYGEVHCIAATKLIGTIKFVVGVFAFVVLIAKYRVYNLLLHLCMMMDIVAGGCIIIAVTECVAGLLWPHLILAPIHLLIVIVFVTEKLVMHWLEHKLKDRSFFTMFGLMILAFLSAVAIELWFQYTVYVCYRHIRALQVHIDVTKRSQQKENLARQQALANYFVPQSSLRQQFVMRPVLPSAIGASPMFLPFAGPPPINKTRTVSDQPMRTRSNNSAANQPPRSKSVVVELSVTQTSANNALDHNTIDETVA